MMSNIEKNQEPVNQPPVSVTICHCERCGESWPSLLGRKPKQCPRCKSYKWDVPRPQ